MSILRLIEVQKTWSLGIIKEIIFRSFIFTLMKIKKAIIRRNILKCEIMSALIKVIKLINLMKSKNILCWLSNPPN